MADVMTIAEIEKQFGGEWVLVGDVQTNEVLQVQGGDVLFHSKDRDEVWRRAAELKPKRFAVFYNGKLPEDMHYIL